MNRQLLAVAALAATALVAIVLLTDSPSARAVALPASRAELSTSAATTAVPILGAGGLRVQVDGQGRFVSPDAAGASSVPDSYFNTSSDGLVEIMSATPGGGVVLNLQGRFRTAVVARPDPSGTWTIECGDATPAARTERKE